jgi:predicted enzyme related to lactoylglutathione lyase
MLKTIDRVILRVPQLKSAVKYYRDVLGLSIVREDAHVATLRMGPDAPELVLHDDPDLPAEAVYFLVDDVRELHRRREELRLGFVNPPTRISRGWRAAVKDPFGTVIHILDRTAASDADDAGENIRGGGTLFAGVEQKLAPKPELLIRLYEKIGRTADDLPYTAHFESIFDPYSNAFGESRPDRAEVWRHLLNLRKAGKLPKLGEARSTPPEMAPEDRSRLRDLLAEDIGRRDRLPYSPRFDELVDRFNATLKRPLSPHLIWRLIATLAK